MKNILRTVLSFSACCIFCYIISGCLLLSALFPDEESQSGKSIEQAHEPIAVTDGEAVMNKKRAVVPQPVVQNTQYSGSAIAIPTPEFKNANKGDAWMSQFLQDSLTSQFASLSGMTVLDRKNEDVAITEQKLQERGYTTFENAVEIGKMTNAQYVLAGSIQRLPTRYALTFRVNDIETNEVKSAFSGQYTVQDIENGTAIQDIISKLFDGLDIPITDKQLAGISNNSSALYGTKTLAQGMMAENTGDLVEAVSYFIDSSEFGNREADARIVEALQSEAPMNIKEQANYYKMQIAKWKKISTELRTYVKNNLPILVYDFSSKDSDINSSGTMVDLTYNNGIKIFKNRKALLVYNKIYEEWDKTRSEARRNNESWVDSVSMNRYPGYSIYFEIGLYNKYDELLVKQRNSTRLQFSYYDDQAVPRQSRLFNEENFQIIKFRSIPIDDNFIEPLQVKIIATHIDEPNDDTKIKYIFSYDEWLRMGE